MTKTHRARETLAFKVTGDVKVRADLDRKRVVISFVTEDARGRYEGDAAIPGEKHEGAYSVVGESDEKRTHDCGDGSARAEAGNGRKWIYRDLGHHRNAADRLARNFLASVYSADGQPNPKPHRRSK